MTDADEAIEPRVVKRPNRDTTEHLYDSDHVAEARLCEPSEGHSRAEPVTLDEIAEHRLENLEGTWPKEWVEDVDIRKIRIEGVDPEWEATTKGYSRAEMRQMARDLGRIQELRKGGYTDDDFFRMRESTNPHEQRLANSSSYFYSEGISSIEIERDGDEWVVERGRHRAWAAKEVGLESVPAVVRAPERSMIEDIRLRRR